MYPKHDDPNNPDITSKFCTIRGEILDEDGNGKQGVNVIARNVNDPLRDARSMVSGTYFPGPVIAGRRIMDGHYTLAGLVPGQVYEVTYEELTHEYDDGGGFMPLGTESPEDVGSGVIPGPDGVAQIPCNAAGDVALMPAFQPSLAEGSHP